MKTILLNMCPGLGKKKGINQIIVLNPCDDHKEISLSQLASTCVYHRTPKQIYKTSDEEPWHVDPWYFDLPLAQCHTPQPLYKPCCISYKGISNFVALLYII